VASRRIVWRAVVEEWFDAWRFGVPTHAEAGRLDRMQQALDDLEGKLANYGLEILRPDSQADQDDLPLAELMPKDRT
jgi:hypothetical protein